MSAKIRDELVSMVDPWVTFIASDGCPSSATKTPESIADAIIARFPYISADQSLYDYAASLRQQLLDTRAELEKEQAQQMAEQAEEQENQR